MNKISIALFGRRSDGEPFQRRLNDSGTRAELHDCASIHGARLDVPADQFAASTGQTPPSDLAPPPVPQPPAGQPHVMGKTETALGLAKLYGISLNAIQAVNPTIDVSNLKPGDVIRLPNPPSNFTPPRFITPP